MAIKLNELFALCIIIHLTLFCIEISGAKGGLGKTLRRIMFRSGFEKEYHYNNKVLNESIEEKASEAANLKKEPDTREKADKLQTLNHLIVVLYAYTDILNKIYPSKHSEYIKFLPEYKECKKENDSSKQLETFCLKNPEQYTNSLGEQIKKARENFKRADTINREYKGLLQQILDDFKFCQKKDISIATMRIEISTRKDKADYMRLGAEENPKNYKELFNDLYEERIQIWIDKAEEKVKLYESALENDTMHLLKKTPKQPQTSGVSSSASFYGESSTSSGRSNQIGSNQQPYMQQQIPHFAPHASSPIVQPKQQIDGKKQVQLMQQQIESTNILSPQHPRNNFVPIYLAQPAPAVDYVYKTQGDTSSSQQPNSGPTIGRTLRMRRTENDAITSDHQPSTKSGQTSQQEPQVAKKKSVGFVQEMVTTSEVDLRESSQNVPLHIPEKFGITMRKQSQTQQNIDVVPTEQIESYGIDASSQSQSRNVEESASVGEGATPPKTGSTLRRGKQIENGFTMRQPSAIPVQTFPQWTDSEFESGIGQNQEVGMTLQRTASVIQPVSNSKRRQAMRELEEDFGRSNIFDAYYPPDYPSHQVSTLRRRPVNDDMPKDQNENAANFQFQAGGSTGSTLRRAKAIPPISESSLRRITVSSRGNTHIGRQIGDSARFPEINVQELSTKSNSTLRVNNEKADRTGSTLRKNVVKSVVDTASYVPIIGEQIEHSKASGSTLRKMQPIQSANTNSYDPIIESEIIQQTQIQPTSSGSTLRKVEATGSTLRKTDNKIGTTLRHTGNAEFHDLSNNLETSGNTLRKEQQEFVDAPEGFDENETSGSSLRKGTGNTNYNSKHRCRLGNKPAATLYHDSSQQFESGSTLRKETKE